MVLIQLRLKSGIKMAIRVSLEIERDVRDVIERYARENGLDTSSSMQALLMKGIASVHAGEKFDIELLKNQANEEYHQILENTNDIHAQVTELAAELKLMHHLLETGWQPNEKFVVQKKDAWTQVLWRVKDMIIAAARPFMPKAPDTKQIAEHNYQQKKFRRQ